MNAFLRARTACGFEYLISFRAEHSDAEMLRESKDFFSKTDEIEARKSSRRFKVSKISEHVSQIFPRTGRISGPEVRDGAKLDVPTTDRQNKKRTCIL